MSEITQEMRDLSERLLAALPESAAGIIDTARRMANEAGVSKFVCANPEPSTNMWFWGDKYNSSCIYNIPVYPDSKPSAPWEHGPTLEELWGVFISCRSGAMQDVYYAGYDYAKKIGHGEYGQEFGNFVAAYIHGINWLRDNPRHIEPPSEDVIRERIASVNWCKDVYRMGWRDREAAERNNKEKQS